MIILFKLQNHNPVHVLLTYWQHLQWPHVEHEYSGPTTDHIANPWANGDCNLLLGKVKRRFQIGGTVQENKQGNKFKQKRKSICVLFSNVLWFCEEKYKLHT